MGGLYGRPILLSTAKNDENDIFLRRRLFPSREPAFAPGARRRDLMREGLLIWASAPGFSSPCPVSLLWDPSPPIRERPPFPRHAPFPSLIGARISLSYKGRMPSSPNLCAGRALPP